MWENKVAKGLEGGRRARLSCMIKRRGRHDP